MTMSEWLLHASVYWTHNTAQREGQAYFNSLWENRPDIANRIRTTSADPFYNNDRLPLFFQTVEALWD